MIKTEIGSYTGSGTVTLSALNSASSQIQLAHRTTPPSVQLNANQLAGSLPLGMQSAVPPWIEILEQPKQADLRFRYKCEGRSAGSLLGENSTGDRKSFPTIRINNFDGSHAIVVVSCVSTEKPYYVHPHNVVGTDCKDGVCTVKVKGTNVISFTNIGIQCVTKKDIKDSLAVRQKLQVNPFGTEPPGDSTKVDLSSVRLCFQAFLADSNRKFTRVVPPVVSQPIYDKKVVHNLTICRLSKQSGCASGGEEVFLLCEKINREDVQVRFFELSNDRDLVWEAYGQFQPQDVHHQYAVVFLTPPYRDVNITSAVTVFVQLRRPSDDSCSDPKPFQFIPVDRDPFRIEAKRKRQTYETTFDHFMSIPASVLPLSDTGVDEDNSRSSDDTQSASLKQNLKKKVARRMQLKDEDVQGTSQNGLTASLVSGVPRYSYDDFGTTSDGLQFVATATASADDDVTSNSSSSVSVFANTSTTVTTPGDMLLANGGPCFTIITTIDGDHQLVEVVPSAAM